LIPNRIDGIIFDLDATLVNLGGFVDWKSAEEEIVQNFKSLFAKNSTFDQFSTKGFWNMLEEMCIYLEKEKDAKTASQFKISSYEILGTYEKIGAKSCLLLEGCVGTLEWLHEREILMGICTSNSLEAAEEALNYQGIREFFTGIVGRTPGLPMKPHPAQLEKCFNIIRVKPKNGIMVGDSHKDIIAGKKVGAYTIGIPFYFSRVELMREAGVDRIIDSISKIPPLLESFKLSFPRDKPSNIAPSG
jgi:phosphoglycolate phosphatase-like HAD superfamily hydrolase